VSDGDTSVFKISTPSSTVKYLVDNLKKKKERGAFELFNFMYYNDIGSFYAKSVFDITILVFDVTLP